MSLKKRKHGRMGGKVNSRHMRMPELSAQVVDLLVSVDFIRKITPGITIGGRKGFRRVKIVDLKGTRGVWLCVHGNGCEQILTILFTGSGDTQEEKGVLAERLRCRLEVPVSLS